MEAKKQSATNNIDTCTVFSRGKCDTLEAFSVYKFHLSIVVAL